MEKRKVLVVALAVLCAVPLVAQTEATMDAPRVQAFGGFQYTMFGKSMSPKASANGFDASASYNLNENFGIVADVSAAYQTINYQGMSFPTKVFSFTAGPQFTWNRAGRFSPFVHFLVGGAHVSASTSLGSASGVNVSVSGSVTGLTEMAGGGVDLRLNEHVALRLAQADWAGYYFRSLGGGSYKNFRTASGVVVRF